MKYLISSLGFWSKNVTSILNKNILLFKIIFFKNVAIIYVIVISNYDVLYRTRCDTSDNVCLDL